ncbi:RsmD family RNA methyltransferase [Coraliomargarita parva]|uniref:RsmD family RNA methyltransferase n=1 Tax=Coraliomargarita parva TaxID=3014050 RepID=UPI0022B581F5|nr:RsmD family RNA methyltransferase [Coraliomargarita parva]
MRITGGKARGIPLKTPKGDQTRPATDRMREATFSSLGPSVEGCRVADLFAGTGSYGLEAVSRGATSCSFYENQKDALNCLRQNAAAVAKSANLNPGALAVQSSDVYTIRGPEDAFDLIFLDPPYSRIEAELPRIFEQVLNRIAAVDARVLLELPGNLHPEIPGWELSRRIGKAGKDKPTVAIFTRQHGTV